MKLLLLHEQDFLIIYWNSLARVKNGLKKQWFLYQSTTSGIIENPEENAATRKQRESAQPIDYLIFAWLTSRSINCIIARQWETLPDCMATLYFQHDFTQLFISSPSSKNQNSIIYSTSPVKLSCSSFSLDSKLQFFRSPFDRIFLTCLESQSLGLQLWKYATPNEMNQSLNPRATTIIGTSTEKDFTTFWQLRHSAFKV